MTHTFEELKRFQRGETRHLYAAYRDGRPDLYFIENGTADAIRAFAKSDLRCANPDCDEPDLTTVANRTKRQSFKHSTRGAGGHSKESEFHIAAKGVIQRWAAAQDATVIASLERDPDGTRQRRTDVLVEWPDGARVAFEPQYSAVTVENWSTRHDWYKDHQIPDIWLFGHGSSQLAISAKTNLVKLNALQLTVARTQPILWVNPQREEVATIDVSSMSAWDGYSPIRGRLRLIPVDDCVLTKDGITHPEIDRLHGHLTELLREADARRSTAELVEKPASDAFAWAETVARSVPVSAAVKESAWDKALKARPILPAPTSTFGGGGADGSGASQVVTEPVTGARSREAIGGDAWLRSVHSRNVTHTAGLRWLETAEGRAMTARFGGTWPDGLPMWAVVLPLPTHQWQGFIYERFVLTCEPGDLMDEPTVVDAILDEFTGKEISGAAPVNHYMVRWAVKEWHQHAAGVLIKRLDYHEFTRFRDDETPPLLPRSQLRP